MSELPPELRLDFVEEEENKVYTDVPELQDAEDPSPIVEMKAMLSKEPIDDSEIFGAPERQSPKKRSPREAPAPEPEPQVAPKKKCKQKAVRYNKDGTVRKPRQYTEEQRKAMAERMRKVRLEAGKNKAKKEEERAKEQKHKELMKKKRDMEIEEIEEKIKKKSQPQAQTPQKPQVQGLTKEDIEKAQFDAILKYDTLRKQRKAKKKQEQQVKQYQEDVKKNLQKELSWRDVAGEYAGCF